MHLLHSDTASESSPAIRSHPAASCYWNPEGETSPFKRTTGGNSNFSESVGAFSIALNGLPLPLQTELMQFSPDFLASPTEGFSKRHLRLRRHSLPMSPHESVSPDTHSLFPAGCICFLHTLTKKRAKV